MRNGLDEGKSGQTHMQADTDTDKPTEDRHRER